MTKRLSLALGRGSGLDGLDLVAIEPDGRARLTKAIWDGARPEGTYREGEFHVSPEAMRGLVAAVNASGLLRLKDRHVAEGVADGTQWVLLLKQRRTRRAMYFDNVFPHEVTALATSIDELVKQNSISWQEISQDEYQERGGFLWAALEQ